MEGKLSLKRRIRRFIIFYDFPLIRLLYLSRWFRLAFIGAFLLAAGVPLSVVKIWRTSSSEFQPVIKVSGLDLLQAWALKRSAIRAEESGRIEDAIHCWQSAIGNNAAAPELSRSLLQLLGRNDFDSRYWQMVGRQSFWLLRLSNTNLVDLEFVTSLFEQYEIDQFNLSVIEPQVGRLTPTLMKTYAKALFNQSQFDRFADYWEDLLETVRGDPELRLYHAAYALGWGSIGDRDEYRLQLTQSEMSPDFSATAHRLQLFVSFELQDEENYARSLHRLEALKKDRAVDHINYWMLLANLGKKQQATRHAERFSFPPRSAHEAVQFANAFARLGLRDLAIRFLRRYSPEFGYFDGVWLTQAALLIQDEMWEELYEMALTIRKDPRTREMLYGYSYYLQGRAELGRERHHAARDAFKEIPTYSFGDPLLGLHVGANLFELGFSTIANEVLLGFAIDFDRNPSYWILLFKIAIQTQQPDQLLMAAEKLYRISPWDYVSKNNYAAGLLSQRIRADEAVTLTFELYAENPEYNVGKINHSLALVMNDRVSEASDLLQSIDRDSLSDDLALAYHMAWFEVFFKSHQYDDAHEIARRIDPDALQPAERRWFHGARQQMNQSL